jgi:DinB superfamily
VAHALLTVDEIMAILPVSVPRLAELTDGLSARQLSAQPSPGEWSANDILAHLRAAQDVLGTNIRRIVTEDRPTWKRLSPRQWQRTSGYQDWEFGPAFEAFGNGRAELLAVLAALRDEDWERVALVTVSPHRTAAQTGRFFGDWLARHERDHLEQVRQTIDSAGR